MILLYFIIIPILIFIIWLVVRKKWKALLWTVASLTVVGIAGWYLFLSFVSAAFQEKCETVKIWEIEGYEIREKSCIGFAGPPWSPIYLYQKDTEIDYVNYKTDSCLVEFTTEIGNTLQFDLCEEKMTEKKKTGANNI
ncbi:hypothetical protein [Salinimicrobium sp. TH3]|uniref:hypothetical protein n=1 Tax=Salinimicrobium sp. TH3 TaxID=2997342 RepID=UPI002276B689|nr:hypothetical protein [Salinimicrobium sp. TH3]MCY2686789.1 hypothetical protein [Salinimicrobium sp. TH3]